VSGCRGLGHRVSDCGQHSAEDVAWLAHCERELLGQLVDQEQEHRCVNGCGSVLWSPALDPAPVCVGCGWEMVGLPIFREFEAVQLEPPGEAWDVPLAEGP